MSKETSKTPEPLAVIRPSAKLLKPFYWTAAILAGLILAYANNNNIPALYWLLILPGALTLWALVRHLNLHYTKLSIMPGKLRYETGVFSRSIRTMEISKVQDVRVDQAFLDRILDLGTIAIETAGETSRLSIAGVEEPNRVAEYILEAIKK